MLESLRPFDAPRALNTDIAVVDTTLLPAQRARLSWGQVGTLPAAATTSVRFACQDKYKEKARDRKQQKVIGSDGESFIVFEDATAISYKKENKDEINISFQKVVVAYSPTQLAGQLVPVLTGQTSSNDQQCEADFSFLDQFAPEADFEPEANFSPIF